jgi:hypothetical protein
MTMVTLIISCGMASLIPYFRCFPKNVLAEYEGPGWVEYLTGVSRTAIWPR